MYNKNYNNRGKESWKYFAGPQPLKPECLDYADNLVTGLGLRGLY